MRLKIIVAASLACSVSILYGQNSVKAVFRESKPGFYQTSILKDDREVAERTEPSGIRKSFSADLSGLSLPNKVELYSNQQWHNPPISQGNTGTC
ncbi:hypothetical protein EHM76_07520, partial [bacterium]